MAINNIPVSARNMPFNGAIQANGSYTLPQQGFIPASGTRPLAAGHVPDQIMGHAGNPGFISAAHVDAANLPQQQYARAFGLQSQTAQIQVNTSIFVNS